MWPAGLGVAFPPSLSVAAPHHSPHDAARADPHGVPRPLLPQVLLHLGDRPPAHGDRDVASVFTACDVRPLARPKRSDRSVG